MSDKIKVKMKATICTPEGSCYAGKIFECDEKRAAQLVAQGFAEYVDFKKPEAPIRQEDPIETTDEVPDLETTDEVPDLETTDKVPDLETTDKVPDLETTDKVPDLETTDEVPDLETTDEVQDLETTDKKGKRGRR